MSLYRQSTSLGPSPGGGAGSDASGEAADAANKALENVLTSLNLGTDRDAAKAAANRFAKAAAEGTIALTSDPSASKFLPDFNLDMRDLPQSLPQTELSGELPPDLSRAIDELMSSVSKLTNLMADPLGFLSFFFEIFKLLFTTAFEGIGEVLQQQILVYQRAAQAALDASKNKLLGEQGMQASSRLGNVPPHSSL